jgi:hypothetical protein
LRKEFAQSVIIRKLVLLLLLATIGQLHGKRMKLTTGAFATMIVAISTRPPIAGARVRLQLNPLALKREKRLILALLVARLRRKVFQQLAIAGARVQLQLNPLAQRQV